MGVSDVAAQEVSQHVAHRMHEVGDGGRPNEPCLLAWSTRVVIRGRSQRIGALRSVEGEDLACHRLRRRQVEDGSGA